LTPGDTKQQDDNDDAADEANEKRTVLEEKLKSEMPHSRLMWASAKERDGVDDLMMRMSAYVENVKKMQLVAEAVTSEPSVFSQESS
jgi:GTPase Era involved in 16S rRNA processing